MITRGVEDKNANEPIGFYAVLMDYLWSWSVILGVPVDA